METNNNTNDTTEMDKIFDILGVERLDTEKQEELKDILRTVIEIRAKEIADTIGKDNKITENKKPYRVPIDKFIWDR